MFYSSTRRVFVAVSFLVFLEAREAAVERGWSCAPHGGCCVDRELVREHHGRSVGQRVTFLFLLLLLLLLFQHFRALSLSLYDISRLDTIGWLVFFTSKCIRPLVYLSPVPCPPPPPSSAFFHARAPPLLSPPLPLPLPPLTDLSYP